MTKKKNPRAAADRTNGKKESVSAGTFNFSVFPEHSKDALPARGSHSRLALFRLDGHEVGDHRFDHKHYSSKEVKPLHGWNQAVVCHKQASQRHHKPSGQVGDVNPGVQVDEMVRVGVLHHQTGPRVHGDTPDGIDRACNDEPPDVL